MLAGSAGELAGRKASVFKISPENPLWRTAEKSMFRSDSAAESTSSPLPPLDERLAEAGSTEFSVPLSVSEVLCEGVRSPRDRRVAVAD